MKTVNKEYLKTFKGIPTLIRLVSTRNDADLNENAVVKQKLAIINNGAVSFCSIAKNGDISESLSFDIDTYTAGNIISLVAKLFSSEVENKKYPNEGSYDLTITNDEGISYFYDGSLNLNYTIDGYNMTSYIRDKLNMPQLFVFENKGKDKKIKSFELNIFTDNEKVLIDPIGGSLFYEKDDNRISVICPSPIAELIEKYNGVITPDFSLATNIGRIFDYQIRINYSYGDELKFGGFRGEAEPYFLKALINDIAKLIKKNAFGSIFDTTCKTENGYYFVLVSGKGLRHDKWYITDEILQYNDQVIVEDEDGDLTIGRIIQFDTREMFDRKQYNKIIKKL